MQYKGLAVHHSSTNRIKAQDICACDDAIISTLQPRQQFALHSLQCNRPSESERSSRLLFSVAVR